jgi:hypothetical protein
MQLLRSVAAVLAVCLLASSAAADGSGRLAAMLGSSAVKGAQQLNTIPASVTASDGPDATSTPTPTSTPTASASPATGAGGMLGSRGFGTSGPGERQRLAVQLREYLERVFRDRPDALGRIRDAWNKEQEQQETPQEGGAWYIAETLQCCCTPRAEQCVAHCALWCTWRLAPSRGTRTGSLAWITQALHLLPCQPTPCCSCIVQQEVHAPAFIHDWLFQITVKCTLLISMSSTMIFHVACC